MHPEHFHVFLFHTLPHIAALLQPNPQGIREYGVLHKDTLTAGGAANGQAGAGAPELSPCAEAR